LAKKKPDIVVVDYDGKAPKGHVVDGARELMDDFEAQNADAGIWWTRQQLEEQANRRQKP